MTEMMASRMLFVLLSLLLVGFTISSPLGIISRESNEEITDNLLFNVTMAQFQATRNTQIPPDLDWTSDGCTGAPDEPFGWNFGPSCQRHDFGYRNYKAQNRFSGSNKERIDNNFKSDLYIQCAMEPEIGACNDIADFYYEAVKIFGNKKRSLESLGSFDRVEDYDISRLSNMVEEG